MMTFAALHPQESMLQAAAFEVIRKFLFHMQGQGLALHGHQPWRNHHPVRRCALFPACAFPGLYRDPGMQAKPGFLSQLHSVIPDYAEQHAQET
jgi:hypothetical protein